MRLNPPSPGHARAAAKRLQEISERGVPGTVPLARSRALEAVAKMLGFSSWHELLKSSGPASPADHEVGTAERRARRSAQAAVLRRLGFSPEAAAAAVEVVLPSGRFEAEVIAARDFLATAAIAAGHLPGRLAMEAAWLARNLGVDEAWGMRVAEARAPMDGGFVEASGALLDARRERTGSGRGLFAAVVPAKLLYQAYHLAEPPPGVALAAEREIRAGIEEMGAGPEWFARMVQGMLETGMLAKADAYLGALQVAVLDLAAQGVARADEVGLLGWLIHRETGLEHFAVIDRGTTASGFARTELRDLGADTVAEARAAVEAMPEVLSIQERLVRLLLGGSPPP